MNVKITKESTVTRPGVSPVTSTLLDHATVVDLSAFGLRNDEGLWPSYNFLNVQHEIEGICPEPPSGDPLQFDFATNSFGFEFALQSGVQCKAIGLDRADQMAELERVFRATEGRGVERVLHDRRFVTGSFGGISWADADDITPATPPTGMVGIRAALALLEGSFAGIYTGLPTIHMPRAAATMLGVDIVWQGDKAYTRNGSKVAIGGGYDTSESDGTWDLFATGEVYIERSDTVDVQSFNIVNNDVLATVERLYRVVLDGNTVLKSTAKVW